MSQVISFTATHDEAKSKALESVRETFGGPIVDQILAILEQGIATVPEILAALKAAGIELPSWVGLVVNILLAIMKPYLTP